jgi:hypothetical protein
MTGSDPYEAYRSDLNELFAATRESESGYWNALLTFNGIIISVFGAVAIISQTNRLLISILIVFCFASAGLLVANFLTRRKFMLRIGSIIGQQDLSILAQEAPKLVQENVRGFEHIQRRESLVSLFLVIEAAIILWLVLPKW